jgi:2-polyprenyl-3-methyl-5-hydroxy-6-metoxy-1,4-benzoquinol methylase
MPDFSKRSTEEELMDDLASPEDILWKNLTELELVNKFLGGYSVVTDSLTEIGLPENGTVKIMDLGCGGGDTLRVLSKWLGKKNLKADLIGVDWNPVMINFSKKHAQGYHDITFRTKDIFDESLIAEKPDFVLCNLFCHHFEHDLLVKLVRRIYDMSSKGVVINDLHRHWFAYYSIKYITRAFSGSYMVQNDGPLSVARAFSRQDLISVMKDAGISNYKISWRWAFRWKVVIKKSA